MDRDVAVDAHKQRVITAFDARAASWSQGYGEATNFRVYNFLARRRAVMDLLGADRTFERVLDAGCGSGDYLPGLLERAREVYGMDASAAMIEQAKARWGDETQTLHLTQGDVEHLDYPDAWFDGIVCAGVLEYLSTERRALRELHRVLRPGGIAVLTVPNLLSPFMLLDITIYWLLRTGGTILTAAGLFERLAGRPRLNRTYRHRYHMPWRLNAILREVGFEVREVRFCSVGSFALGPWWPGAVHLSRWAERFSHHPVLGLLGLNYLVKCIKR